jgi:hypothetical protein
VGLLVFELVSGMTQKLLDARDNKLDYQVPSVFGATLYICETEGSVLMEIHVFRDVTPCAMAHSATLR